MICLYHSTIGWDLPLLRKRPFIRFLINVYMLTADDRNEDRKSLLKHDKYVHVWFLGTKWSHLTLWIFKEINKELHVILFSLNFLNLLYSTIWSYLDKLAGFLESTASNFRVVPLEEHSSIRQEFKGVMRLRSRSSAFSFMRPKIRTNSIPVPVTIGVYKLIAFSGIMYHIKFILLSMSRRG